VGDLAVKTVLIHGFLGLPSDWQEFSADVRVNLWSDVSPQKYSNLTQAGEQLAEIIPGEELTIIAYSLGGRIALHWPQKQWSRIRQLILVSVHGGLDSSDQKKARLAEDKKWSERFLKEEWSPLMKAWNSQTVFHADSVRPLRFEKSYSREDLAAALTSWSLGAQEEQTAKFKQAPFPITYVYGEKDTKFANYAKSLGKTGLPWSFKSLPGGHSLHLSHSREIAAMMQGASLSNPLAER
jgi:2-succinyl-6-hydroxy-2,4-cyclohexadiene-1-carboxylate synthase